MKSFRKVLTLNAPTRRAFIHLTPEVEKALAESGIREGLCLVNAMHITASVFTVSYTHLDVYKRQVAYRLFSNSYSICNLVHSPISP